MDHEAEMKTEIFGVRQYQILDYITRSDRRTLGQIQPSPPRVVNGIRLLERVGKKKRIGIDSPY